jgi:hypothetical protein
MATFGNPVLGKMLKDMEKQRADATKAQARGARGGRTPDEAQLATMLGMQRLADAMETAMWADRMLYQYGKRTQTTGDPHWNAGRPVDLFTDDAAGAGGRGVDAERFRRMGPDFLRNR